MKYFENEAMSPRSKTKNHAYIFSVITFYTLYIRAGLLYAVLKMAFRCSVFVDFGLSGVVLFKIRYTSLGDSRSRIATQ